MACWMHALRIENNTCQLVWTTSFLKVFFPVEETELFCLHRYFYGPSMTLMDINIEPSLLNQDRLLRSDLKEVFSMLLLLYAECPSETTMCTRIYCTWLHFFSKNLQIQNESPHFVTCFSPPLVHCGRKVCWTEPQFAFAPVRIFILF